MSILSRNRRKKVSLDCGCVPGYFQCRKSQELWEAYAKTANLATYGMATQAEVNAARDAYEAHYAEMYVEVPK